MGLHHRVYIDQTMKIQNKTQKAFEPDNRPALYDAALLVQRIGGASRARGCKCSDTARNKASRLAAFLGVGMPCGRGVRTRGRGLLGAGFPNTRKWGKGSEGLRRGKKRCGVRLGGLGLDEVREARDGGAGEGFPESSPGDETFRPSVRLVVPFCRTDREAGCREVWTALEERFGAAERLEGEKWH